MEKPNNTEATNEPKMLFDGARGTAIKLLNRIERTDAYLDKLLDAELRSRDLIDPDKALLAEIVHGVVRWQNRLDWVLNGFFHGSFIKAEINVKSALRVALYQILFLDRVPHHAAVNEAVEFIKRIRGEKAANLVNAVLRNIIRSLDAIRYPDPSADLAQYLAVYYSHPIWLVKRWLERFGREETEKLLAADNEIPNLTLRINRLLTEPARLLAILEANQVQFQRSSFFDHFLSVRSLVGISQLDLFRQGMFTIQDESAALPCVLLDPQPGERIIDMCAAPGGKTALIGELLRNQGQIVAIDKYESKLNLIKGTCDRLGVKNVQYLASDSSEIEIAVADKIIVDAPCSGLGVLRKKPDIKLKREAEDLPKLRGLQLRLLENATRLLKPGGVLVYSTCTTEPDENEQVVAEFVSRHPEFRIDDANRFIHKTFVTPEGFVSTFPHRHQMDGSFAARLVKSMG